MDSECMQFVFWVEINMRTVCVVSMSVGASMGTLPPQPGRET